QPALITVRRNGLDIPAVAVATKVGHLFVLHRETGQPIFPVEERPVPQNGVDGEQLSPTQPFPVLPRPLAPQSLKPDDAFGVTPEDKKYCRDQISALRNEGVFTPPSLQGTLVYPGDVGGMNWSGVSFDQKHGLLITNTNRLPRAVTLVPRKGLTSEQIAKLRTSPLVEIAQQTGTPYLMKREIILKSFPLLVPCTPPPWGTLVAVDLATGQVRWEVPLGTMPELSHIPESAKWGSINLGGSLVTPGGLLFIVPGPDRVLRGLNVEARPETWQSERPAY